MSYGKDTNQLNRVIPFGGTQAQQAAIVTARPPRQGGARPYWVDTFEPSEHTPDLFRCIPGQYTVQTLDPKSGQLITMTLPWFKFVEHYHGVHKRGAICSGGPFRMVKGKREPCYGCDIFWEDFDIRKLKKANGDNTKGPNRISMRDSFALTIVDYATYFKVEQYDRRTGQVRTNQQGQPFYEWVKPETPQQQYQYANREARQGSTLPWVMGKEHFDQLNAYAEYIGQSCAGCGNMQCLAPLAWMCPQCQDIVIDYRTSTLTIEQTSAIITQIHSCRCGFMGLLVEAVQCQHCQQPRRATIYDVDIQARRVRSTDPNKKGSQLQFLAHSPPRPLAPGYEQLAVPLDLPTKFAPTPITEQAQLWQLGMPQAQPQYAPTGQTFQVQVGLPQQGVQAPNQHLIQPQAPAQPAQPQQQPMVYDPSQYMKPYGQ